MSFIDDQISDYFDTMEMFDSDSAKYPEYDDSFLQEKRQRPYIFGVDWRHEKGGVFYDD